MRFKALKHKTEDHFAQPYMEGAGDTHVILQPTPVPLLQPLEATMEGLRKAYQNGPIDATIALAQLEDYELVTLEVTIV